MALSPSLVFDFPTLRSSCQWNQFFEEWKKFWFDMWTSCSAWSNHETCCFMLFLSSFLNLFLPFFYHLLSINFLPGQWRNTWSRRACRCKGRNSRMARHTAVSIRLCHASSPHWQGTCRFFVCSKKKGCVLLDGGRFCPDSAGMHVWKRLANITLNGLKWSSFINLNVALWMAEWYAMVRW